MAIKTNVKCYNGNGYFTIDNDEWGTDYYFRSGTIDYSGDYISWLWYDNDLETLTNAELDALMDECEETYRTELLNEMYKSLNEEVRSGYCPLTSEHLEELKEEISHAVDTICIYPYSTIADTIGSYRSAEK